MRFLLNPRVEATSEELKRSFLLKKGLTDLEIEQALALAAQQAVTRPGGVARPALPGTLAPLPPHQLAYNPHTVTVGLNHILLILIGYFMTVAPKMVSSIQFPKILSRKMNISELVLRLF